MSDWAGTGSPISAATAYTTTAAVKTYLGISGSGDDTLIGLCVTAAQKWIDAYTARRFIAVTETHYFGAADVDGLVLRLDDDLLTVTTLTNGDTAATTITSGYYTLTPKATAGPYTSITLKSTSTGWYLDTDCWISVLGTWGYSATAPADIVHACKRLAGYIYRQKDAQVYDVTAQPDLGVITVPQGMPKDVKALLAPYRKLL